MCNWTEFDDGFAMKSPPELSMSMQQLQQLHQQQQQQQKMKEDGIKVEQDRQERQTLHDEESTDEDDDLSGTEWETRVANSEVKQDVVEATKKRVERGQQKRRKKKKMK